MHIRVEDLFYLYEKNNETVVALRGLHLEISSGECLVIKGPNGSGKSTLVRILSGFLSSSAGRIYFDETEISTIDPLALRRQYVATIDQKGNLLSELSIVENLALAHSLTGVTQQDSLSFVTELLSSHNLLHISNAYPPDLSAGERQLCAVLAALARNPKVLIADEPSGELDNGAAEKIYQLLKSCAGETTVILVTHDDRAELYADRIVRVRDGRISAQWQPDGDEQAVVDPFGWMQVAQPPVVRPHLRLNQEAPIDPGILVRVNRVGLSYGRRQLFRDISFEARSGDFVCITGSSASGKSSLLKIVAGIQAPTTGDVYLLDQRLSELSRDQRAEMRTEIIAFLAQGDGPIESLSLREYFDRVPPEILSDYATRTKRRLSRFSGGERARIEIHKMLSLGRKVLLFDEPTSQLDDKQSARIAELLLQHVNAGGIAIVSTRDEMITSCATQVISL